MMCGELRGKQWTDKRVEGFLDVGLHVVVVTLRGRAIICGWFEHGQCVLDGDQP